MRLRRAILVAGAASYAVLAGTTTAFTCAADVVTALPLVALVMLVFVRWPLRPIRKRPGGPAPGDAHPWRVWVVLLLAVVAWELAEYLARGSRAGHPTLSSMVDAVDRHAALKAVVFFAWLCLGAAIVHAGRRRARPDTPPAPGLPSS